MESRQGDWKALIVRAQAGDLGAFDVIVQRFEHMAVAYAYSILGDFQLAEDAAQEAFIRAYLDLPMLQEPLAFAAWLRRIVFKQCDRYSRRGRVQTVPLEADAELCDPGRGPLEVIQQREVHDVVLAAVRALPEPERVVTALYYINGYSVSEVGEFLEVPASTVKNRLHTARRRLRERMTGFVEETLKSHAPGDAFSRQVTRILEGIERIGWDRASVLCFTGSVVACMHYLGEKVSSDYVMGISGGAFKQLWFPGWSPALCDLLIIGEGPIRRTFAALGYDYAYYYERIVGQRVPENAAEFYRRKIVESIDQGRPAMAIGIVGPPECCIVSGYDEGGAVLHGRSYFQERPEGYFRVDNWEKDCHGLILIGDKGERPSPRQVLKDSLQWAIELGRVRERECIAVGEEYSGRHYSGLAAYDAMAEALLRDDEFPADNLEVLTSRIYPIGNDGLYLLSGKRAAAMGFLRAMAAAVPEVADELGRAVDAYGREVDVICQAHHLTPHTMMPPEEMVRLAERGRREELARLVCQARLHEEQAVEHLEAAFARL